MGLPHGPRTASNAVGSRWLAIAWYSQLNGRADGGLQDRVACSQVTVSIPWLFEAHQERRGEIEPSAQRVGIAPSAEIRDRTECGGRDRTGCGG